jgi:hypothetical protein
VGYASGLQTVSIAYPPGSAAVRTMAVIPLRNILLDPVPQNITDFEIEQEYLLVDQQCLYGGYQVGEPGNREYESGGGPFVPPLTKEWLQQGNWSSNHVRSVMLALNTSSLPGGQSGIFWRRHQLDKMVTGYIDGRLADAYLPAQNGTTVHFNYTVDSNAASIYTVSIDGDSSKSVFLTPMACYTSLVPIRYFTLATSSSAPHPHRSARGPSLVNSPPVSCIVTRAALCNNSCTSTRSGAGTRRCTSPFAPNLHVLPTSSSLTCALLW